MARIRTVKPEIWTDTKFVSLTYAARLLFIGLLNFVDDAGLHEDEPLRLQMLIFPSPLDKVRVESLLSELNDAGLIHRYRVDGRALLAVRNFARHQKINRPQPSRFPSPPQGENDSFTERSVNDQGTLTECSLTERKGMEGNGRDISSAENRHDRKPTSDVAVQITRVVSAAFDYYREKIGKSSTYTLSPLRKKQAKSRLEEIWSELLEPKPENALTTCKLAIDALAASDFHMGRDSKTNGKTYNEWEHIFRSREAFERWLEESERAR